MKATRVLRYALSMGTALTAVATLSLYARSHARFAWIYLCVTVFQICMLVFILRRGDQVIGVEKPKADNVHNEVEMQSRDTPSR